MPFHCVENLYLMMLDLSNQNWQQRSPKRRFADGEKGLEASWSKRRGGGSGGGEGGLEGQIETIDWLQPP